MADHFFDTEKRALLGGTGGPLDFDTDPIYVMLVNGTYRGLSLATRRAHDFINDVQSNEVTGTGYTAGGLLLTGASIVSDGTNGYKVTFSNPQWTTATINAEGAVFYKRVGADLTTPADDPVIAFSDFGGAVVSTNGTYTLNMPAAGLIQLP